MKPGEDNIGEHKAFNASLYPACSPNSTLANLTGRPEIGSKIFVNAGIF